MLQILAFTCIVGTVLAAPLTQLPLDGNFYPTQGYQYYYLFPNQIADPLSRSEIRLPSTANLLCASIPYGRQSGTPADFNEAAQQAASQAQALGQAVADQIQSGASSVSSQIQDAIASSQSQIQDSLGGAGNAFDQLVPGNAPIPKESEKKGIIMKPLIKNQPILGTQQQLGGFSLGWPELENRFIAIEQPSIINLPRLSSLRIRSVAKDVKEVPNENDKSVPVVVNKKTVGNVKE